MFAALFRWAKDIWDLAAFAVGLRDGLEKTLPGSVLSAFVSALIGIFTEATGYQMVMMGAFLFFAINAAGVLRAIKKAKRRMTVEPIIFEAATPLPARYIQAHVHALEDLAQCQVTLLEVAKSFGDDFEPVVYRQPLLAIWSGTNQSVADPSGGQDLRANLFSISFNDALQKNVLTPETQHRDEALRQMMEDHGMYHVTFVVTAKATAPEKRTCLLVWDGSLNGLKWELIDDHHG